MQTRFRTHTQRTPHKTIVTPIKCSFITKQDLLLGFIRTVGLWGDFLMLQIPVLPETLSSNVSVQQDATRRQNSAKLAIYRRSVRESYG